MGTTLIQVKKTTRMATMMKAKKRRKRTVKMMRRTWTTPMCQSLQPKRKRPLEVYSDLSNGLLELTACEDLACQKRSFRACFGERERLRVVEFNPKLRMSAWASTRRGVIIFSFSSLKLDSLR